MPPPASAPDHEGDALVALDKLDKIGREGVERELAGRGIAAESAQALLHLFEEVGQRPETAGADGVVHDGAGRGNARHHSPLHRTAGGGEQSHTRKRRSPPLTFSGRFSSSPGARPLAAGSLVDPSLARGLSYYTGAIMEIAVPDLAGSLGGGGRYDELVGMFLGQHVPACGFSLGLERIIVVMTERGMFPPAVVQGAADVLVTLWSAAEMADALTLAAELRAAGLRADVYPEADKIGRQFKYAAAQQTRFVAIVGDDERAKSEVAIKNLDTGEQTLVARSAAAAWLRRPARGAPVTDGATRLRRRARGTRVRTTR